MLKEPTSVADADNVKPFTGKCDEGRARRLANLKPVQKGQVLNPRGRPKKDYDLAAMAQEHAQEAIRTLATVMSDEKAPASARVSAAAEILDRGFGRAPASLDLKHTMSMSDEFEAFMRELTAKRTPLTIEAESSP
jgi:hypothetical protein